MSIHIHMKRTMSNDYAVDREFIYGNKVYIEFLIDSYTWINEDVNVAQYSLHISRCVWSNEELTVAQ
jgi:hypothetical protein